MASSPEHYFQTVICNGPWKQHVVPDSLRFVQWPKSGSSQHPCVISQDMLPHLQTSGAIFARKITTVDPENVKPNSCCGYECSDEGNLIAEMDTWSMDTRTADHAKARIRKQVNHYKELVANMTSICNGRDLREKDCVPSWKS